jgi:hypothetical protein
MFFCEKVKKEDIEIHFLRKVKGTNFTKTKNKIMFIVLANFCVDQQFLTWGTRTPGGTGEGVRGYAKCS